MRVESKAACGFKRTGGALLRKGLNVLEEPLSRSERLFIEAMVDAKIAKIIDEPVPEAPASETKLTRKSASKKATSSRVDVPKKPMRVRRAAAK